MAVEALAAARFRAHLLLVVMGCLVAVRLPVVVGGLVAVEVLGAVGFLVAVGDYERWMQSEVVMRRESG